MTATEKPLYKSRRVGRTTIKAQSNVREDVKTQEELLMAKIDTSKISGYAEMTPEQKIAALESFNSPDPDYSGYVKKETFDATASELAALKKKSKEQLSLITSKLKLNL